MNNDMYSGGAAIGMALALGAIAKEAGKPGPKLDWREIRPRIYVYDGWTLICNTKGNGELAHLYRWDAARQTNIDEGNWFSFKRANQHILKWEKHNGVTQPGEAL